MVELGLKSSSFITSWVSSYVCLLDELGQMPQLYCDTPRIDLHGLNWVGVPSMITGCYGLIIRFDNYLELLVKFLQLKGWFLR